MEQSLENEIKLNPKKPNHIAIIMDGNGRWAKKKGRPRAFGHSEGVNSVRNILEASIDLKVSYLTLYTFSTENWNRPKTEVTALMKLLVFTLEREIKNLMKQNVKVNVLGRLKDLPKEVEKAMSNAIDKTKNNSGLNLNIAISYSSRLEILDSVKAIAEKVKNDDIKVDDIDESVFSNHLYSKDIPDPDLLIRTSGEFRISNFLLWQLAYTEMYITETLWPEFRREEFIQAIASYLNRERRFGKVSEQIS